MRADRYFIFIILLSIISFQSQAQKDTLKAAHIDTPAAKTPDTPKIARLPVVMKHEPKREFRGMWIATVVNIDWPSSPNLPVEKQKSELITLLDMAHAAGINAVMLQVRPAADAFYLKSIEPWSRWLTGKQGVAPDPSYDPLEFAIVEAHKRGMELHAWFNPYRATFDGNFRSLCTCHITNQVPDWFFTYGGIKLFNPGIPDVRDYIVKVILHVVDNYDIDGVHMDDYFYPYSIPGQHINDAQTFKDYGGDFTDINDWRRNNVDLLIQALSDSIHAHKPYIKFGIAPFGIWKNARQDPEGSQTRGGDSYYELYADTRKWLQEGWIDYVAPQLYWNIGYHLADFDKLVDWWSDNTYGRQLYIGQAPYRALEPNSYAFHRTVELPNQIRYLRNNDRVQGSVFFSANSLMKDPYGFTDSLHQDFYKYPALPPAMDWLDSVGPNVPKNLTAKINVKSVALNWQTPDLAADKEPVYGYVIYRFGVTDTVDLDNPKYILHIQYNPDTQYIDDTAERNKHYIYVVTALDRMKNESDPTPEVDVSTN
ncbi:MAG: family 10 glycosylhydrolase [Bacteroidetes bacterium]|nr:family 10 glycosylhydrolase [Bacteroidota bacterium]